MTKTQTRHLLFITPGFPENEADTKCIPPLQDLALALNQLPEIQVTVIALHYPYRRRPYQWNGLHVFPMGIRNRPTRRPSGWIRARRLVQQLQQSQPIDCIHSFWLSEAAVLGQILSSRYTLPHFCTLMGQDARKADRFQKRIDTSKVQLAALSNVHAQTYFDRTGKQIKTIIPWGLPSFESLPKQDRDIDLIAVGNLISLKQYDQFVEVAKALQAEVPSLQAKLIGKGPLMQQLRFQIQGLGLSDHIELVGDMERSKVLSYLRRARVFLHPSSYESYGMVITEALAMGCHVVSRPVGIAPELTDWVSLGESVRELAMHCARLLKDPPAEPFIPFTMEDTRDRYIKWYGS